MSLLRDYVRHAERYGPDLVFETAAGLDPAAPEMPQAPDLDVLDLGKLSLQLQRIGSTKRQRWRLNRDLASSLATRLLGVGQDVKTVARMSGLSPSTVRKLAAVAPAV